MKALHAFIGGAAAGALIALLLAPESGDETRARIKAFLKSKGLWPDALANAADDAGHDLDRRMEQIPAEIKEDAE